MKVSQKSIEWYKMLALNEKIRYPATEQRTSVTLYRVLKSVLVPSSLPFLLRLNDIITLMGAPIIIRSYSTLASTRFCRE